MENSSETINGKGKGVFGKLSPLVKRLICYLLVLLCIVGFYKIRTYWNYKIKHETAHYIIKSNNSQETTERTGDILERQYTAYSSIFENRGAKGPFIIHLYKDRKEFKRVNPLSSWAEAFYRYPVCHFYVNAERANPYHWGVHEAVHQLNRQYAGLKIRLWVNEGLALLFSTGKIDDTGNLTRDIDRNTYPIWWADEFEFTDNIETDIANRQFIAVKDIVYSKNPIEKDKYFNTYYVMWWALTYYLYWGDDGAYRDDYMKYINGDTSLDNFYKDVIEANDIEKKIHYMLKNKTWKLAK